MQKKMYRLFHLIGYLSVFSALFIVLLFYSDIRAKESYPCLSTLWPHEKSDLLPDPALIFGKLPNGFRYVMMENPEPRDRVSIHLNIQAGSLYETDEQRGLSHYLEHLMFNGSENFPPGELVKYFQSIGMDFGDDANAHTGFAEVVYDVVLPSGNRESLEKGLLVMKDYAHGALLLDSEIERERGIILAEKRDRDSVEYRTYTSAMKFLFPGARIADRMPIGEESVIKKANRPMLKNYYDTWYRPENMILVMVGDFKPDAAETIIKSMFSGMKAAALPRECPDPGSVNHKGIKTFYHYEKEAGNTNASIQTVRNTVPKPDSFAYQKELLTRYAADSMMNHRLEAMIEKADNPFTAGFIYSDVFLNRLEIAKITAQSAPENWEKTLAILEQSLRQAISFGFTASELERVKKEIIAQLDAAVLKKDTRDSSELAASIIDNLNDDKVLQSPEQEKELYSPFVQSLTPEQVHEAFQKIWNADHRLVLVTGNAEIGQGTGRREHGAGHQSLSMTQHPEIKGKNPEDVIRETFDKSAAAEVKKPEQKESVIFPYLPEPEKPGTLRQRMEIPDLGIEQITYENGLRLNLKKTDFKKNEVLAAVSFGLGKQSEPAPGLAVLAESVLNQSGLGALTRDELDRALAGKNTDVQFSVKENCFLLTGESISEEIPLLFQLLYACIKDPGYREDAYQLAMRQFEQMYQKLSHTIEGAMELSGERFLAGGDARFGIPPYETFQKLTLEQARSWTAPVFQNSVLEISLTGDFDPEKVKSLAARYFGSLPAREHSERKKEPLKFPAGQQLDLKVKTSINRGMASVAWLTDDFSDIYRVRRLSVLGQVFSERLREEIREKLGASYSQYAYSEPSRTYSGYGVFHSLLFIDPEMSDKMIKEVKRIASDLAEKGMSEDELRRALDPILTGIKDMVRTNQYWLNTVLINSLRHPEQLDWARSVQKDYAAITVKEVSEMAKKYLKNENAATIVIKP